MSVHTPSDITAPLAHTDVVVLDYLAALWAESEDLSPELRDELMTTVADYIAVRRTSPADPIADPEQIVGRLGPPEALVASVRRGRMPSHLRLPVPAAPRPRPAPPRAAGDSGTADSIAIGLLTAGAFVLPVISPLAGMIIVSHSRRWSAAQKAASWVLLSGSALCALIFPLLVAVVTYDSGFSLVLAYLTLLAGSVIAGATLLPGLLGRRPTP